MTAASSTAVRRPLRALVAFSGRSDLRCLRLLRPGFRHCFVVLNDGRQWIAVDPLMHRIEVAALPLAADADLAALYRARGLTVVETVPRRPPPHLGWPAPFTCVETVKRVLGLRAPWVVTPWQLYRYVLSSSACEKRP